MNDSRIAELTTLAAEEQIALPMPIDMILYFEKQGCIVDLVTGAVYRDVLVTTTPSAQAVCHLLATVAGDVAF
jgi:hypothetical protein